MSLSKIRNFALIVLLVTLSFWGGYVRGSKSLSTVGEGINWSEQNLKNNDVGDQINLSKNVDLGLFWNVWQRLSDNYLDGSKIDIQKMVYGAIEGMTASLDDPYTAFLPPIENARTQEDLSGEFNGVGIQLGFIESTLAVMAPLPDNPAIKAGVKAGDLILNIKDEKKNVDKDTQGMSLIEAVNLIRGEKGTMVNLTLYSKGEDKTHEVDLVRDTINVASVDLEWVGENKSIAHLRVMKFGEKTGSEWRSAVGEIAGRRLTNVNFDGIVLDLRNNPGGYLQAAVDLASEFIPEGVVVQQEGKKSTESFSVNRKGQLVGVKMVILVNKGSASASEILAGALRERVGVKLIGEETFGKGTVQEAQELPGGAGLHVTIARWLLPNGTNIHGNGLDPDVTVVFVPDPEDDRADNQLERAVEELGKKG